MKLVIEKSVTVLTPTMGNPLVRFAIDSVENQTYKCNHLLVADGRQARNDLFNLNIKPYGDTVVVTPENTGANGFYGHRIYAAYPHLVNSDYILFLDEDNWLEPNHVETLIETIEDNQLDFSYSLRKIYDKQGNYICDDNAESLGGWPIWFTHDNPQYHVDTSSYCFKREFLIQCCHIWHHGWGADRRFFNAVKKASRHATSGKHTLCYRLDGNTGSVTKDFFDEGNQKQLEIYNGVLPWLNVS